MQLTFLRKDYSSLPDIDEVFRRNTKEKSEKIRELLINSALAELPGIDNDESKQESYSSFHEQPLALKIANNAFSRFWGNANPAEKRHTAK